MKKGRLFSERELREMAARTLDLILEAMQADDKDKAKNLCHRMYREFLSMHDFYMYIMAELMSYIYRNYGSDVIYQALREAFKIAADDMANSSGKLDLRSQVGMTAHLLRGHLQPIAIEEDDEKVCITMEPCGSGQRLLEQGAYGPPRNLATIDEPHVITWGMRGCPVYCAHEPVLQILATERMGYPTPAVFPAKDVATESCRFCFYKDPQAMPEEVYTRLGRKKGSSG